MKALIDYAGIARRETYFFPHDAFRELLLNALIHRDYKNPTPIQIFKDKIDIWNIGKMPDDIKLEDLFTKHRSEPRNPNIANVFFRCGYIESLGRGYFKIQELCKQVNAKLPVPENLSGGISVVCNASEQYLKLAEQLDEGVGDELRTRKKSSQKTREKIVQIINNNPNVTTAELAEQLELTIKGIEWQLKQLKENNIIRRVGADKGGHWEILN